jgi:Mn2+/Fe2+ NRAMP family transporter
MDKDCLTTVVAVLGTTIIPYLFFWKASQEAEDIRAVPTRQIQRGPEEGGGALNGIHLDTLIGMGISNFIALAILITAAATLHASGVMDIQLAAEPKVMGDFTVGGCPTILGWVATAVMAIGVVGVVAMS